MASIPPKILHGRKADYIYKASLTTTVHLYMDPNNNNVIVKRAPKNEADIHTEINSLSNPSIIRLIDATQVSPFSSSNWLVLEYANNGTLRDLLAHAHGDEVYSTPRKIPAAFCFHILAGILDATIAVQESHGVQHIDLHAGNVVFSMPSGSPWPPVAKVIDFGKTFQLPEEENHDDDSLSWGEALSPSIGPLVRALLAQTDVLEDDFLRAIKPLRSQTSPLEALRRLRAVALTGSENVSQNMPEWLMRYFGENIVEEIPIQRGTSQEDVQRQYNDDDGDLGDIVIRLRIRIVD